MSKRGREAQSPASNKTARITSFFQKPKGADDAPAITGKWCERSDGAGSLLTFTPSVAPTSKDGQLKIAAFDLDDTLVTVKVGKGPGKTFPTGPGDWKWWHPSVPGKLRALHQEGFTLAVLTNQLGVSKGKVALDDLKERISLIHNSAKVPIHFLAALGSDSYRKPSPGMWEALEAALTAPGGGASGSSSGGAAAAVDRAGSLYVGDAAGRPKDWKLGKKKDFSCSDRRLARNVGVGFHTPEAFFLQEAEAGYDLGFDPRAACVQASQAAPSLAQVLQLEPGQEMLLLVGCPASGKSTLTRRHLEPQGYVRICRDVLKSEAKCMKACEEALAAGRSVVVDNTSPSIEARRPYLALARTHGISRVRAVVMGTARELADHMNAVRERASGGAHPRVPAVGFNVFKSKLQEPKVEEGFTGIVHMPFIPSFDTEDEEKLFMEYM